MKRPLIPIAAVAALSACATANPPTITATDVARAMAEADRINDLPITQRIDAPTFGSATYDGQIGADLIDTSSRVDRGSMLADLEMIVNFENNLIGGQVTNVNLVNPDGDPDQRLDGRLQISGFETEGDIDALAVGELSGVSPDGFDTSGEFVLDMEGALYNDRSIADAVYGEVEGTAEGGFDFDVNGVFFGTER